MSIAPPSLIRAGIFFCTSSAALTARPVGDSIAAMNREDDRHAE
jgi:hypothetical protein